MVACWRVGSGGVRCGEVSGVGAETGETQSGCECMQCLFGMVKWILKWIAVRDAQLEHIRNH